MAKQFPPSENRKGARKRERVNNEERQGERPVVIMISSSRYVTPMQLWCEMWVACLISCVVGYACTSRLQRIVNIFFFSPLEHTISHIQ